MPDDSIHHPHDKLFKQGFKDPETAAGFLNAYLPETIAASVIWSQLALQPGSFVDSQFRSHESDLLFTAPLCGREAMFYFLFEHQTHDVDTDSVERHVNALQTDELRSTAMTLAQKLRQEGRQEGQILAQQRAVLDALEIRFQLVPEGLREEIEQIDETQHLQSLLRAAIQTATLEDFSLAL